MRERWGLYFRDGLEDLGYLYPFSAPETSALLNLFNHQFHPLFCGSVDQVGNPKRAMWPPSDEAPALWIRLCSFASLAFPVRVGVKKPP